MENWVTDVNTAKRKKLSGFLKAPFQALFFSMYIYLYIYPNNCLCEYFFDWCRRFLLFLKCEILGAYLSFKTYRKSIKTRSEKDLNHLIIRSFKYIFKQF